MTNHTNIEIDISEGRYDVALTKISKIKPPTNSTIIQQIRALNGLGRYDEVIALCKKNLHSDPDLTKQLQTRIYLAGALWNSGLLEEATNELQIAEIAISKNHENHDLLFSNILNIKGSIVSSQGEIEQALHYYNQSLNLRRNLGDNLLIAHSLNNIGTLYDLKGNLDEALNYYLESLELKKALNNQMEIATAYHNIGIIYLQKRNDILAKEYLDKALNIRKQMQNHYLCALVLDDIIRFHLARGTDSTVYVKDLENIALMPQFVDNKYVQTLFRVNKAAFLMRSKSIKVQIQATELLDEIINGEIIHLESHILATKLKLEFLLIELKLFNQDETLELIYQHLTGLMSIARKENLFPVLVEALILWGKLKVIEGDYQEATKYYNQAKITSVEKGFVSQSHKIDQEIENIKVQLNKHQQILNKNKILKNNLEKSDILEYLKEITQLIM